MTRRGEFKHLEKGLPALLPTCAEHKLVRLGTVGPRTQAAGVEETARSGEVPACSQQKVTDLERKGGGQAGPEAGV